MHNANLYEDANTLQKRDTAAVLAEFIPKLTWKPQELILDIGCGSGDVTSGLLLPAVSKTSGSCGLSAANAVRVVDAVGVDVSPHMVAHAREHYGGRHVSFAQLDISNPIPNRKTTRRFSKIFSFYCLHWIKDQNVALLNIHRLLEDGGEAVLVFLASNPLFNAYRELAKNNEWSHYMTDVEKFVPVHQDHTDPALSFSMTLDTIGFQVMTCEAREKVYTFGNANQLFAALKAVNPFLDRLPTQERKSAFMMDLVGELKKAKTPGMAAGQAQARYTLMVAHVKKPVVLPPEFV